jgi:hypothetical protein
VNGRVWHATHATRDSDAIDSTVTPAERNMDQDTLILAVELIALFVFGGLGLWLVHKKQKSPAHEAETPNYDMRRDGQRLAHND